MSMNLTTSDIHYHITQRIKVVELLIDTLENDDDWDEEEGKEDVKAELEAELEDLDVAAFILERWV